MIFFLLFSETFFSNSQNVFSLLGTVFDRWINTTALSGTRRYTNTCRPEQPYQKSMLRYKNKIRFVCLIKQNKILYNMSTLLMSFQQILLIRIFNSFSMCFSLIHSFIHSFIHSSIHSSVPLRSVPFRFISFHPIPFHSISFHSLMHSLTHSFIHSIPFNSVLFHFISFRFISFHSLIHFFIHSFQFIRHHSSFFQFFPSIRLPVYLFI